MSIKKFIYNGKEIAFDANKNKCPLCGEYIVLKRQRPKDGCIKVMFLKCTCCDFDTRGMERI